MLYNSCPDDRRKAEDNLSTWTLDVDVKLRYGGHATCSLQQPLSDWIEQTTKSRLHPAYLVIMANYRWPYALQYVVGAVLICMAINWQSATACLVLLYAPFPFESISLHTIPDTEQSQLPRNRIYRSFIEKEQRFRKRNSKDESPKRSDEIMLPQP